MKQNKTYLHLGVTLIVSACAVLMFYDTFFQSRVLLDFFDKLMSVLSPVIYGLVFAYLLAPIVDFFDRYIQKGLPKVKSSLVRGLSILVTWICVIALIYLMFSILIPELVDSTKTLADNFESYYKTVYNWVNSLVENQTIFSDDIYSDQLLSALNGYYDKLVKWVTDTVIPQAQVAIVAVTGGIWSVVIFLKNILIGMMISVYLLARKESFAKQSKKILYAILPETPYRRTLRAVAEADRIFSGFVRGKLLDSLIIGILCFICCSIFKFPYTPIISVFVGVTNIIPIFGPFLGAIPSAFLILLVSPKQCLYFILFIIALQQFDGNILGPKILGKSTGISSFWVIVAIVVGGGFGGRQIELHFALPAHGAQVAGGGARQGPELALRGGCLGRRERPGAPGLDLHEMQHAFPAGHDVQLVTALPPVERADFVPRTSEVFRRGAFAGPARFGCRGHQWMMRWMVLARSMAFFSPSASSRSSIRRMICNWCMCSRSTSSTLYLLRNRIGTHVAAELLARRTVLSKPPPARSKM